MGLSARAIAPHLGVSHTAVNKAARRGRIPREADGSFDLEKVRSAWNSNVDARQQQRGTAAKHRERPADSPATDGPASAKPKQIEPEPGSLTAIQIEREKIKLRSEQNRLAKDEGRLVDAEEIERQIEARFAAERQALLAWPSRIIGELAAELEIDERTLRKALDSRIRQFLAERSRAPVAE